MLYTEKKLYFSKQIHNTNANTQCGQDKQFFNVKPGGAVGWCTALQARRSRFRFPMVSLAPRGW